MSRGGGGGRSAGGPHGLRADGSKGKRKGKGRKGKAGGVRFRLFTVMYGSVYFFMAPTAVAAPPSTPPISIRIGPTAIVYSVLTIPMSMPP